MMLIQSALTGEYFSKCVELFPSKNLPPPRGDNFIEFIAFRCLYEVGQEYDDFSLEDWWATAEEVWRKRQAQAVGYDEFYHKEMVDEIIAFFKKELAKK